MVIGHKYEKEEGAKNGGENCAGDGAGGGASGDHDGPPALIVAAGKAAACAPT